MTVYIEFAILDNMTMNFLLLYLTAKLTFCSSKTSSLLISATIGTIFAIILPLINLPSFVEILAKVLLSIAMVLTINTNGRRFFLQLAVFYLLTFAFGGAIFGIFYLLKVPANDFGFISYNSKIPIGLILIVPIILLIICEKIVHYIKKSKQKMANIYACEVTFGKKTYLTNGYFDSGNTLMDENKNFVCIASLCFFEKIKKLNIASSGDIKIYTVTCATSCKTFRADKLKIHFDAKTKEYTNCLFAIVQSYIFPQGAEILLNANCIP